MREAKFQPRNDGIAFRRRESRERRFVSLETLSADESIERRGLVRRDGRIESRHRGSRSRLADLVTNGIRHGATQIILEASLSVGYKLPKVTHRSDEGHLNQIVSVREASRPAGETSMGPATQTWPVANEQAFERVPVPGFRTFNQAECRLRPGRIIVARSRGKINHV